MTADNDARTRATLHGFRRRLGLLAVAATLSVCSLATFSAPAQAVGAWPAGSFSLENENLLFSPTNQSRASAGLPALRADSYLKTVARWRSKDMSDRDYFDHKIPPSGEMVFARLQRDGYCFKVAGENIGLSTFGDDIATAHLQQGFMKSPSHRDNILGKTWKNMAVGAYEGPGEKKLYTVLFSEPCGSSPAPTPKATPKPTPRPTARPTPAPTSRPTATPTVTPARTAEPPRSTPTATTARTDGPTAGPTAAPIATTGPTGTPSPTFAPTETPAPTATLAPAETPTPAPSAGAVIAPSRTAASDALAPGSRVDLRVRDRARSGGPFDDLLRTLFGGLLGW